VPEVEGTGDDRETMERRGDGMLMNCIVVADGRSDAVILLRSSVPPTHLTADISLSKCPGRPLPGDHNQFSTRQR
jgi:hypothetical protein